MPVSDLMDISVPIVVETSGRSERAYDIYSRLLKDRIVLLSTAVDDVVASLICAQLLFLESQDPEKEIYMYINSPGGVVTAGMAIYDTMQYITSPVATVCMGQAASMGALLLAAGETGMRYALPNSRIMSHQPLGGYQGQVTDVEIHAKEMQRMKKSLNAILSRHTGQNLKRVVRDTDRDYFMTASEAREYGLVDRVLVSRADLHNTESSRRISGEVPGMCRPPYRTSEAAQHKGAGSARISAPFQELTYGHESSAANGTALLLLR